MECLAVFFVFLVCFAFFVLFAGRAQAASRRWNQAYSQISTRYQGVLSPANWFGRPIVRINYGSARVVLSTVKITGRPWTQLMISWPDRRLRFEIKPIGEPWSFTARNLQPVQVEFPRSSCDCRTNRPADFERMLSDGMKWQVEQLHDLEPSVPLSIVLNRGQLIVRIGGFLRKTGKLDDFVRFGLELFDQAMLTQSDDIEFLNPVEVQVIENPKCQVCGDTIYHSIVFCVRCRTAHCQECWEYTGICSTYACGETRYSLPQVAHRIEKPNSDVVESSPQHAGEAAPTMDASIANSGEAAGEDETKTPTE